MIKYHILALLSLVAAAISGVEAYVQFMHPQGSNTQGYLMIGVMLLSGYMYIRTAKIRRAFVKKN